MLRKLKELVWMNRYPQLSASDLEGLVTDSMDISLLPSSNDYGWHTSEELGGKHACAGEVITLGKARYANIKYCNGRFISSNNNVIESRNTDVLKTRYLFYFLSYTSKHYYVESTSYPKFDKAVFDDTPIDLPSISVQSSRINKLDSLSSVIQKEKAIQTQLDSLIKSRFNGRRCVA